MDLCALSIPKPAFVIPKNGFDILIIGNMNNTVPHNIGEDGVPVVEGVGDVEHQGKVGQVGALAYRLLLVRIFYLAIKKIKKI